MAGNARSEVPLPAFLQVLGSVTNSARPVANALVIALNLNSFDAVQTFSMNDGSFSLPRLPTGVYKIIAVKAGFVPATTMIVPTKPDHRVAIRLQTEKQAKGKDINQEIWEIRGSLPPEILREIDAVMAAPVQQMTSTMPRYDIPRFRGEMVSMTGVSDATSPSFAQTAVGVQGRLGDNWQLGFRGNVHRVDDPSDDAAFGTPLAQSSGMSMELRSSPHDTYRLASTKSWWRYGDDAPGADHEGDLRAHNFEWQHGDARVAVRYLAQQNLFVSNGPGSNMIEIAGDTMVYQTGRSDLGVSLRVAQESLHNTPNATLHIADLAANASLELVPALVLHYGMASRLGIDGAEWAPRTGAEWRLTKGTSIVGSGQMKVVDQSRAPLALPTVVVWSDDARVLPKYSYSFGIVAGQEPTNRVSAIVTVTEVDAPLRVVFNDGFEQFWDGFYVDAGDVRRDLRVAYRKDVGGKLAFDISTTAGSATPTRSTISNSEKAYVTGDLQSTFVPTGTSLAVSYRQLTQPQANGTKYCSERMNVRMAQSLHLPLDLKVLLGVEVAHARNAPFLLDMLEPEGATRKYIGGLAVNF